MESGDREHMETLVVASALALGTVLEMTSILKPGGALALGHFAYQYVNMEGLKQYLKPNYSTAIPPPPPPSADSTS